MPQFFAKKKDCIRFTAGGLYKVVLTFLITASCLAIILECRFYFLSPSSLSQTKKRLS